MGLTVLDIFIAVVILLLSFYSYFTRNFGYWKKIKVKGPSPIPFFGNYKNVILGNTNEALELKKIYDTYKNEKLIGVYLRNDPRLLLKDPDIIKDVLIKDFHKFTDRGLKIHKNGNPFLANLVNLEYKEWKPLRNKLSPIFTSGKLKNMFYLLNECACHFQKYTKHVANKNEPIDCRELTARFTTDAIGVCVFGLDMKAIDDDNSGYRKFGRTTVESSFKNKLKRVLRLYFPDIYDMVGFLLENASSNDFFISSLKETIDHRKRNNVKRNDFIDHLIDLQESSNKTDDFDFTDDLLLSQAWVFFVAGFEVSACTMFNTLYELALNPDIQNKLREEIMEQLAENDGQFTYDGIKNMHYLDKVIKETLRKYPPATILRRKATAQYEFKNTKVIIPEGTRIAISLWAIHRDPDIYPHPEIYDPERFNEETEKKRHSMNYLPFGDGPHNCIGLRYAKYQTKIGIAAIIEKFQVSTCDKTIKEYQLQPQTGNAFPMGGYYLKVSDLNV